MSAVTYLKWVGYGFSIHFLPNQDQWMAHLGTIFLDVVSLPASQASTKSAFNVCGDFTKAKRKGTKTTLHRAVFLRTNVKKFLLCDVTVYISNILCTYGATGRMVLFCAVDFWCYLSWLMVFCVSDQYLNWHFHTTVVLTRSWLTYSFALDVIH